MKSQQFMRSLASAWSAVLLASSVANAATLYVATTGSDANPGTEAQPFRTIAQGVAVAATGDTVQVAAVTYAENVTWANKSLILRGAGPGLSIIDGGQAGACLTISSDANIAGFTIQNGKAPTLYSGGGINHTQGNFTVANCAFTGNTAPTGHGGAINNLAADAGSITSCTFTNNTARDQGGALYNRSHATSVANCTFIENRTAGSGGAIYNSALGPGYPFAPTITGCTFTNNSGGIGGAVANENCAATVNNCIFTGNAATGGNASLLAEKEFSGQFHEGEKTHVHISIVGQRVILVVLFDQRSSLGLVRLRVKKAAAELVRILDELVRKSASDKSSAVLAEITDDDIDNLFND
jgi:predicted outer membrane repeat protein